MWTMNNIVLDEETGPTNTEGAGAIRSKEKDFSEEDESKTKKKR